MADCARLESVCAFTGTVGSNPTLSATPFTTKGEARQETRQPGRRPLNGQSLDHELLPDTQTAQPCAAMGPVPRDGVGPNRVRPGTEQP